jgi:hypothetical protein
MLANVIAIGDGEMIYLVSTWREVTSYVFMIVASLIVREPTSGDL